LFGLKDPNLSNQAGLAGIDRWLGIAGWLVGGR